MTTQTVSQCPLCGRTPALIVCDCRQGIEDEYILRYLSMYREELKIRPHVADEITDRFACIITAYMHGLKSRSR